MAPSCLVLQLWMAALCTSLFVETFVYAAHNALHSPWESTMIWKLPAGQYSLNFCTSDHTLESAPKVAGMVFEILPLASSKQVDVDATTQSAIAIANTFSTDLVRRVEVHHGSTITAALPKGGSGLSKQQGELYRVDFGDTTKCVRSKLEVLESSHYMLFTEHAMTEVSVSMETSPSGAEGIPQTITMETCLFGCYADRSDVDDVQDWVGAIAASLLITLTSLVGVAVLGLDKGSATSIVEYMTSFAAGCLLGVVVFHLYPEGSNYLSDYKAAMGLCVLGGILFSIGVEQGVHMILNSFGANPVGEKHHHGHSHHHHHHHSLSHSHNHQQDSEYQPLRSSVNDSTEPTEDVDTDLSTSEDRNKPALGYSDLPSLTDVEEGHHSTVPRMTWRKYFGSLRFVKPIAWITAAGDFFHAFTDGVVLGVAFKSCSSALGWTVAMGIVLHEVPHRVGDFFIFLKAGMVLSQALLINFIASLASLFGVLILLGTGSVSEFTLGVLLGVGAGALVFIAMTELLSPMLSADEPQIVLCHVMSFVIGCVLMALSTLQDVHCHRGLHGS